MRNVQLLAVTGAARAAVLYLLIGLGLLHIGRCTEGTGDQLLGFGRRLSILTLHSLLSRR